MTYRAARMEAFYEFLTGWLRDAGWGPTRLAEAAEVSQSLVSKWVNADPRRRARPSPKNLERLAPVLGRSYEDLMKLAGYLPGEPSQPSMNPRRAAVLTIVRDLVPDEDLTVIEQPIHRLSS